jgi:hypothetical protein
MRATASRGVLWARGQQVQGHSWMAHGGRKHESRVMVSRRTHRGRTHRGCWCPVAFPCWRSYPSFLGVALAEQASSGGTRAARVC